MLELGTVGKPVGLRGEVKLHAAADFWDAVLGSARLELRHREARRPATVTRARPHGPGVWVVEFEGVGDRQAAEALRGDDLVLDTANLDVPPPAEIRPFQVRGLRVVHVDGTPLGEVVDLVAMPAHDVFVIRHAGREHWIPIVDSIVQEIDFEQGVVRVSPPEGLLEL